MMVATTIIAIESALIGLLLHERVVRQRAKREVAQKTEYEEMIADLTVHTAHADAHDELHGGLDGGLARVARYAGANRAILDQYGHGPNEPPVRLTWPAPTERMAASAERTQPSGLEHPLEIPLCVDDARIGHLTLYRHSDGDMPC